MLRLATARAYLARANAQVFEGQERVIGQAAQVERLRRAGRDGRRATIRLVQFRHDVDDWREHRKELRRAIDGLGA